MSNSAKTTDTWILCCGLEFEFTKFEGIDRNALSKKSKDKTEVLCRRIVRIGNETDPHKIKGIVEDMGISDRQMALLRIRAFTFDYPETFNFDFTFKEHEKAGTIIPEATGTYEIKAKFPVREYAFVRKIRKEKNIPYPKPVFESWEEVKPNMSFRLELLEPQNEKRKTIEFTFPSSKDEVALEAKNPKDLSKDIVISLYTPRWVYEEEDDNGDKTERLFGLGEDGVSKLSWKDQDMIERVIFTEKRDAFIDVIVKLKHPKTGDDFEYSIFQLPVFYSAPRKTETNQPLVEEMEFSGEA